MNTEQLDAGARLMGLWSVYTGRESPLAAKTTGTLVITDRNLYFKSGLTLQESAAADISNEIRAFDPSNQEVKVGLSNIAGVKVIRKYLIPKSLQITLRSGEQLLFHFGAMSPQRACEAICARTGLSQA